MVDDFAEPSGMKSKDELVRAQEIGKAIEASADATLNTGEEAKALFQLAKKRLQNVNNWHKTAETISAVKSFKRKFGLASQLFDVTRPSCGVIP